MVTSYHYDLFLAELEVAFPRFRFEKKNINNSKVIRFVVYFYVSFYS